MHTSHLRFVSCVLGLILISTGHFPRPQAAETFSAGFKTTPVTSALQPFLDDHTVAGAVTLVAQHGKILSIDAMGLADLETKEPMKEDTLFWIASMTKPITAVAILILQDEGKLSVEDPVEKYLPEFKNQWLLEARTNESMTLKRSARVVKIRDLLTHTSGLGDFGNGRPDATLAELVIGYSQQPLQFVPGSKWSYSNAGINTLGRIVEVVARQPYAAFLESRIFQPLGMKDTTFWLSSSQQARLAKSYRQESGRLLPTDIFFLKGDLTDRTRTALPAGGLFSTARDYYRFCEMMLHGGRSDDRQILSPAAVQAMTQTQTGDILTGFTDGMSFGFGFAVVKQPADITGRLSRGTFGHGGAYGTQAWTDPNRELVLILMVQRANFPNADRSEVRRAFQNAALGMATP